MSRLHLVGDDVDAACVRMALRPSLKAAMRNRMQDRRSARRSCRVSACHTNVRSAPCGCKLLQCAADLCYADKRWATSGTHNRQPVALRFHDVRQHSDRAFIAACPALMLRRAAYRLLQLSVDPCGSLQIFRLTPRAHGVADIQCLRCRRKLKARALAD